MKNRILFCLAAIFPFLSCTKYAVETGPDGQGQPLAASISDGLYGSWNSGDKIALVHNGQTVIAETLESGRESGLSVAVNGTFTEDNPLYAVFPADYHGVGVVYYSVQV